MYFVCVRHFYFTKEGQCLNIYNIPADLFIQAQTYKPWIGNCLLKLQSYSECSRNALLPPRSYRLSAS